MRFPELLEGLPPRLAALRPGPEAGGVVVRGLQIDSRRVAPGDVFVALRGETTDGHLHLRQALELGAVAVVLERLPEGVDLAAVPTAIVSDSRQALAHLATHFFGHPSQELALVGVTGTNGKTSTTHLIESILAASGRRVGLIGTVEVRFAGERWQPINTTPESLELQRTLRAMRTRGIDAVAMEVSSHGLTLGRIEGCHFASVAFTNVTQDHLDFHGDMDRYLEAKTLLFDRYLRPDAGAVVNLDDPAHASFEAAARRSGARLVRVGRRHAGGEVHVEEARADLHGTHARLRLPRGPLEVELPLVGEFNLENLVVAVGVAVSLDVAPEAIAQGVAVCRQVPGRVERVGAELPGAPTVLVDYAHTPDALDKLFGAIRPLSRGRLIGVFGCGGDRDRSKRPLMAEAAAAWCDRIVLTSDNPRTENPLAILAEVEPGLGKLQRAEPRDLDETPGSYALVPDRREAIGLALSIAHAEDAVVIAGKGHEDYQIIGSERLPFDDRVEALRVLQRGAGR